MSTPWSHAFKQSLKRPGFLLVLLVLFGGAVGINAATSALKLHFRKLALPLRSREGLTALPLKMGNWICVPETRTINPDEAHELQTDQYVFRDYVDLDATTSDGKPVATREEVLALDKLPRKEFYGALNQMRVKNNNAVISLAVTYYTGKVDTVPHVPERCYVADGFQPSSYDIKDLRLGDYAPGAPRNVKARFIDFEDQTTRGAQNRCVTYFFHANGRYEQDPNQVRLRLQHLTETYAYFAKIEVMTLLPSRPGIMEKDPLKEKDRAGASATMQKFLTAALPEVEKLLPDSKIFTR
ncbi:MAG: hypothetical protein JWN40_1158 [Phycisphaerales bacterium]|nr:hypothetical protein [Phycisphaerales bacterium]